jgi:glycyl-tRNA synthetase beta chain
MVGEFPELQGVMGGYYASHDRESQAVAQAIEDHYKPRFSGDSLPRGPVGLIVALADKLETLVGMFGIGQLPTGDKDPFALRRHALGVIRMLTEGAVPIDLNSLITLSLPAFGAAITDPTVPLLAFIYERLAGSLREQGYSAQEVDAVLSLNPQRLVDVTDRLKAVRIFAALPEAASLAAANKRVGNILKKAEGTVDPNVKVDLLAEPAEIALNQALNGIETKADTAFRTRDYAASLRLLAALREPVDAFFESVMVNAEDQRLRANRLGLLAQLHAAMNRVADLSKLAT